MKWRIKPRGYDAAWLPLQEADVALIVAAFAEVGDEISRDTARAAWQAHSDDYCAGWLNLPTTNEAIRKELADWIEPDTEEPA